MWRVGIKYQMPNNWKTNILFHEFRLLDGVTNDSIVGYYDMEATEFVNACYKVKNWTNPFDGTQPYINTPIRWFIIKIR